jgi:cytochrome o ubiquinol oxidase subunit 2
LALPKSLKSGTFILAKAVIRCRLKIQRSGKERIVMTPDQPQQSRLGAPSRADLHGKPDEPPDGTGPFRCLRSVNARAARCAVLMAPIVLTACQPAVLDPQGPVGLAEKMILIDSLAIMLAIVVPTIAATFAFAWWFRASNERARYLPDWAYSGRIELITWGIPLLVIMLLGGVAWIGSHDLDPAKPLPSNTPPLEVQVVSLDWKWLFIYPSQGVASVNRLVVPAGVPLHFSLTSASVMNVFFIPQLGSMIYTMNGMSTQLNLRADAPGTLRGLSAHYSGDGFPDMHFDVLALPPEQFAAWIEATRGTGPTLDPGSYAALARQSINTRPFTFRVTDPELFQLIVTQKLPPGPGPRTGRPDVSVSPRTED